MCTLTIIPRPCGIRLGCNRDEQRTRLPAEPPSLVRIGDAGVIMPVDPASGGTWIAANDAGLVASLLNVNPKRGPTGGARSRGTIIPSIMGLDDVDDAVEHVMRLKAAAYRPFRLVILDRFRMVCVRSEDDRFRIDVEADIDSPLVFSSSGLGDHLVEQPRQTLFDEMFSNAGFDELADVQDAFHRHRWPDRPHLSVNMTREDAYTVSHTLVEIDSDAIDMSYVEQFEGSPVRTGMSLTSRVTE